VVVNSTGAAGTNATLIGTNSQMVDLTDNSNGVIQPGLAPGSAGLTSTANNYGTLTITGNLSFQDSSAQLVIDLQGHQGNTPAVQNPPVAGTDFDTVTVGGQVNLNGGTVVLLLHDDANHLSAVGDQFPFLIDNSGPITGALTLAGAVPNGYIFSDGDSASAGNTFVLFGGQRFHLVTTPGTGILVQHDNTRPSAFNFTSTIHFNAQSQTTQVTVSPTAFQDPDPLDQYVVTLNSGTTSATVTISGQGGSTASSSVSLPAGLIAGGNGTTGLGVPSPITIDYGNLVGSYTITETISDGHGNTIVVHLIATGLANTSVAGLATEIFCGQTQVTAAQLSTLKLGTGILNQNNLAIVENIYQEQLCLEHTVNRLYQEVLGRSVATFDANGQITSVLDAGGLTTWTQYLAQVGNEEQLRVILLSSTEFFVNEGGNTTAGFLRALYEKTLGRELDAGGLAFWSSFLATQSRFTVVADISFSTEGLAAQLDRYYLLILKRHTDNLSAQNFYVPLLQTNQVNLVLALLVNGFASELAAGTH
jgi:hypothetical protein